MDDVTNPLVKLELPRRWEHLVDKAEAQQLKAADFVEKVDDASQHIDILLTRIQRNGGGFFEIIHGLSGSGKTTFIKTLPRFFDVVVHSFDKSHNLIEISNFIEQTFVPNGKPRIILIEKRDIPSKEDLADSERMLANILEAFRVPNKGSCLILWPITNTTSASTIAQMAWETGRDSVVDTTSKGIYQFRGLPKQKFHQVADTTCKNLTGDGLAAFGISDAVVNAILPECETIADFFAKVDAEAEATRTQIWSVLRERVRPHLWIVLPGDTVPAIESSVKALTQGSKNRIDIDLLIEALDQPEGSAPLYIAEWKKRRDSFAHLLRAIDLRLFALPPNVSLAAVRAWGEPHLKGALRQQTINLEAAKNALKSSRLYKAVLIEIGLTPPPYAGVRDVKQETEDEYRRIQVFAAKGDKSLNKCLGTLFQSCLVDDAPGVSIVSEKKSLPNSTLKPDIMISLGGNQFICLEPTWRTTGVGVEDEVKPGQNTVQEAHIKVYLLNKAAEYVQSLGL